MHNSVESSVDGKDVLQHDAYTDSNLYDYESNGDLHEEMLLLDDSNPESYLLQHQEPINSTNIVCGRV